MMDNVREKLVEILWKAWAYAEEVCGCTACSDCPAYPKNERCMTALAVDHMIDHGVTVQEEGHWINIPPYRAINGDYNKAQECPKCHAFFVSNGNEPYSNHPYCCECGARLSPTPPKGETDGN